MEIRAMPDSSDVAAPCGTVHGSLEGGVHVFRGIPYAAAPLGALRFAPPQPAPVVADIDATRFGAISLQDIDPLPEALPGTEFNFYAAGVRADEDCLNLNVWTADPAGKAPVYVFIHGGAWLYGSGTGDWASGANLARREGIVVVTINYRLGLLGGLWLGDYDPQVSNLAAQDQIQALRWVRDNIAAFGGDPEQVTIGGQSAGAMSSMGLLCAPDARGLFHRAVIESGHTDMFIPVEDARRATRTVLERLHIDPDGDDVIERLRATSTPRFASAQREFGMAVRTSPVVADDVIIDADPLRALGEGCARDVDLLIGSTSEEDRLFSVTGWAPPTRSIAQAAAELLPEGDGRAHAIELYTRLADEEHLDAETIDHTIATDHSWSEPVRTAALAHASSGGRTYHFEFAWASAVPKVGAAHLVDLPFFFGNLDAPGVPALLGDEVLTDPATVALGENVSSSLAQFVRSGDLSQGALGAWPLFIDSERSTMIIDRTSQVVTDRLAERLDFWNSQRGSAAKPLSSIGAVE
jgi:para-nitrobenzyl esterase